MRLEAAKDLLDRAGFSMDGGGKVPNTAVQGEL